MIISNGTAVARIDSIGGGDGYQLAQNFYGGTGIELTGMWAGYGMLYKRQLWVGTVVRKLAMATARMPFDIKIAGPKGYSDENGPLAELMKRPNARLSGFRLWRWTSSTYDIYGEAFWVKLRDRNGRVRELHPMHPTNVVIRRDLDESSPNYGNLEYVYTGGTIAGAFAKWAEDDVVAFTSYNPDNMHRGLSNLEGLRSTLLNEDAARRANAAFWKRGARPSVVLKHPKTLSDPAIERLRRDFDARHQGVDQFGGTNLLEEGLEVQVLQLNAEEMQYVESRKLNREEVCASYDVPPPVVHILDHATFSNITEQLRSQYRDTMAPRFEDFEAVVDHQLVPDFYGFGEAMTRFNMDEVLRGDFETRATAVVGLVSNGVMRPAEARPLFGLDPAGPEADVLYANAALQPLGTVQRGQQQVALDGSLIPQPLALEAPKAAQRGRLTVRSIMGRLAQVKADKVATRDKLVAEHAKELRKFFDEQRASVKAAQSAKAAGLFEPTAWDSSLAEILGALSAATSQAIGTTTATDLGGSYDPTAISDWVNENAKSSAKNINQKTAEQIDDLDWPEEESPDDAIDGLFDGPVDARADEISWSRVAMIAGLAGLTAASQSGAATKTWNVNSANPRASHAAMDGETVGVDELFSNGMNAPGDPSGGADEVAGCNCGITFDF